MTTELEERFQELVSMKNVMGVIVLNEEGAAIKSSLDPKDTEAYAKMVTNIVTVSKKEFKEVDPSNDITFMRFRLRRNELMIVPDKKYLMVVIDHPQD